MNRAHLSSISQRYCAAFGLIVIVSISGCVRTDQNPRDDVTRSKLINLGQVASRLLARDELSHMSSIEELTMRGADLGLIPPGSAERREFDTDGWGRPFHVITAEADYGIGIVIISCGENQLYEEGHGDDLVCEVQPFVEGNPVILHK